MGKRQLSSREFNHDPSGAKRASEEGPVFITHRGEVSHVLLAIEDYRRLNGEGRSLVDLLGMEEGDEDIDFEPPRAELALRPADLG